MRGSAAFGKKPIIDGSTAEFNKLAPNISAFLENADGVKGRRRG